MNVTQLRYFTAIAEHKSFSRAASRLRIAQPALSRQMKLLERDLGASLFARHNRGIELTQAGEILLRRANPLLHNIAEIRAEIIGLSTKPSGLLRIGWTAALSRPLFLPTLGAFFKKCPQVRLELQVGVSSQLRLAVLNDTLDAAIVAGSPSDPHLHVAPVFSEGLWLVGPPKKKYGAGQDPLFQIAELPLIVTRTSQVTRQMLDQRLSNVGLRPNIVVETDSAEVIKDLVHQGVGHAIAPYSMVLEELAEGRLSGTPLEGFVLDRTLIRRKDRAVSPALRQFEIELKPYLNRFLRDAANRRRRAMGRS